MKRPAVFMARYNRALDNTCTGANTQRHEERKNDRFEKRKKGRGSQRRAHLSDEGVVAVVTADIQQQVQGGGGCPGNDGPEEREGQQGVGGEDREEDVPGMIALRPTERTNQHLQRLREPADHRQVPKTDRYIRQTGRQIER